MATTQPDETSAKRTVSQRRNLFEVLFKKFNTFYEKIFSNIGKQLGHRPLIYIFISIALTGLCSLGFLRSNIINNADILFIPTDCKSVRDRDVVAKKLPVNYDDYYLHQDVDLGIYGDVIFITRNRGNIRRPNVRNELARIYNLIQHINVTYENRTYFYEDLCAKRDHRCVIEGDLFFRESFWQRLQDKELQNYLANDLYTDDDGIANFLPFIFGNNFTINFEKSTLFSKVLKLHFNLRRTSIVNGKLVNVENISRMWEQAFLEFFEHFHSVMVQTIYSVSTSIDQELEKNIMLDMMLVVVTFMVMIVVATICLSIRSTFAQSPMYLSGSGVLATMLGLVSGFGICLLVGIPMCPLVFVTPFLVIGVGTDDMFLIYSAYRRTKSSDTTVQRLAETFRLCGSGITITSLTNVIAFLAGATTNFYGIRLFCLYTSASLAFCYFYQIMLFGSTIALYNNCINNNRHTVILCLTDRTSSTDNPKSRRRHRQQCLPLKGMFVYITKPLFTTYGQIIVCSIFVIYTIFAVYGALQMRDGMKLGQLLNDKSYAKLYYDTLDEEFDIHPLVQFIITEPIPYWRHDYIKRIRDFISQAKQLDGMDKNFEIAWFSLLGYNGYEHPLDNGTLFMDTIHGFVNLFPPFANDLIFNKTHLLTSRFYLKYAVVHYNSNDGRLVNQLYSLTEQSQLPIKVYSSLFKYYEQMYEVIPNIIQTFLIAIEAMYLATLLMIPDLKSVIIIISTMGMILTSLVATLHIWGIQASSVMMVELVMSVGFCSDFCVHIVHAFLTGTGTRKERAQQALINMGMPILCACISSIIGVFFLGTAHSYLFRTFFKTIIAIMILGAIHALCFLPVILSVIGSHWPSHMNNRIQHSDTYQLAPINTNDTQTSGNLNEEILLTREKLQRTSNTIEEEEDKDELMSTTTKNIV
ncbi:unnamed protein product [Adineta ricciae]|uniref:SSD domain-containing protein n=1 Tax=Adineta ricciae TaxID=249248 RepID=A0A815A4Y8_ADIRI|nr:unnamed protein product [Adineta ricciae]CAF1332218.1 unnamed protein product [Adineta ricciae]